MRKFVLTSSVTIALVMAFDFSLAFGQHLVFFEQDQPYASEDRIDMRHAISTADAVVQRFMGNRTGSIVRVIGHVDLTEIGGFELSTRRALAVKALLIQRGIPSASIMVIPRGSTQPLVVSGGYTPEPQNRRVEIQAW